jgi:hypothetical protein
MATRRERLERRAELRRKWAESRQNKAEMEWNKSDLSESVSGIPLGQPILAGHHSEGRHRRAIERAHRAMERAFENKKMAENHISRAAGLESMLDNTIFSDDPDAIEALEAKIVGLEEERSKNNQINKIILKKPAGISTPEKIADMASIGIGEETAKKLFEPDFCGRIGIPSYVNHNIGGRIKAARDRLVIIKQTKENQERAEKSETGVIGFMNRYGSFVVTFSEKPDRSILTELKSAGYRWLKGSWVGPKEKLPMSVSELLEKKTA